MKPPLNQPAFQKALEVFQATELEALPEAALAAAIDAYVDALSTPNELTENERQ